MAVRRLLGYVPQQLSADASLTGRENVTLFARVFDVPRRERAARVGQALAAVGLTDAADRLAGTCSGGMVRRLELVQALVNAPRLLIVDEPTIGLDPRPAPASGSTSTPRGRIRALGTPAELREGFGARRHAAGTAATDPLPTPEDVFRDIAGSGLDESSGDFRVSAAPARVVALCAVELSEAVTRAHRAVHQSRSPPSGR